jgi:hypothetical protein
MLIESLKFNGRANTFLYLRWQSHTSDTAHHSSIQKVKRNKARKRAHVALVML